MFQLRFLAIALLVFSTLSYGDDNDFPAAELAKRPKKFEKCLEPQEFDNGKSFKDAQSFVDFFVARRGDKDCRQLLDASLAKLKSTRAELVKHATALEALKQEQRAEDQKNEELKKSGQKPIEVSAKEKAEKTKARNTELAEARKAMQALAAIKKTLYLPPASDPNGESLMDRCGDVVTWASAPITLSKKPEDKKEAPSEVWYLSRGYAIVTADSVPGGNLDKAYDQYFDTLTQLGSYVRKPVTQKGFDHVYASQRVEIVDGKVVPVFGKDNIKNDPHFKMFFAGGSNLFNVLSYWYWVDNVLETPAPTDQTKEFSLSYRDSPEMKSFPRMADSVPGPEVDKDGKKIMVPIYSQTDAVGDRISIPLKKWLPQAFGGWCIQYNRTASVPFIVVSNQTGADFKFEISAGPKQAKTSLSETIHELLLGEVL